MATNLWPRAARGASTAVGPARAGCTARTMLTVLALAAAAGAARPAAAQLIVTSADGGTTFQRGSIAQLQAEATDNANGDGRAYNLFFRRLRLEGQLDTGNLSFYFETDSGTL